MYFSQATVALQPLGPLNPNVQVEQGSVLEEHVCYQISTWHSDCSLWIQ